MGSIVHLILNKDIMLLMDTPTKLILMCEHWEVMLEHVRACLPEEACGLLAGDGEQVLKVLPIRNIEQSPIRFRMDPQEQVDALFWIEEQGLSLMGIFHSHPSGPHQPSETDLLEAAYPEVAYLVWSRMRAEWNCRAFILGPGGSREIGIQLVD
jgi:proteasome lid subunit RPN8/RPN11